MKAAIVRGAGQAPVYGDFDEPVAAAGEHRIAVAASAVSRLAKNRAAGTHYSSSNRFPFVVGIDGTGQLDDGRRIYFVMPRAPYGGMAERTVVPVRNCIALPDALDDVTAAAIANPGMSSWVALTERARLKAGETVLVNGATGTSGRLAVQIARHLGAGKVIATGRRAEVLETLGADATIQLVEDQDALGQSFKRHFAQGVDVVLDYLWGNSAACLLHAGAKAGAEAVPIRFVQIGALGGGEISLPSAVLRSSAIELMGSGIGSVAFERLLECIGELLRAAVPSGFRVAATPVPLADFERAWASDDSTRRTVFTL